jgi:hypothetical protein
LLENELVGAWRSVFEREESPAIEAESLLGIPV